MNFIGVARLLPPIPNLLSSNLGYNSIPGFGRGHLLLEV